MNQTKKRVLFCSEFSALNTGFAKMGREIISRIAKTGRYEIAELANFGHPRDPRGKQLPWKYYGVMPDNESDPAYASKASNAFGEWRYEDTLLDFRPDIVVSWLDIWMAAHQATSPLRPYYNLVWNTTCDGDPQEEEWIDLIAKCDGVFTYSDWAGEVLKRQGGRQIKYLGRNSAGVDINVFHPMPDKKAYRNPNISSDEMFIVGTVMRNQKRKLYPDLILAFKKFLEYACERDRPLANKTFLYLHVGYPDVGWDIPRLIKESGIGHKILITYLCRECKTCFPSIFKDARTQCINCGKHTAGLTNVSNPVPEETLAQVMNIFDVYVQYSLCLTKDQEIKTIDGWKKIQDIKIGEMVFTHKNRFQPVKRLFKNLDIGKKVLKITPRSDFNSLELTENHPVLCLQRSDLSSNSPRSIREILGSYCYHYQNFPSPQFREAGSLTKGDILYLPIDDREITPKDIDLYTNNPIHIPIDNRIHIKHGKSHNRYIKITPNFAKFIGLFTAEGYANRHSTKLTLHNKEMLHKQIIAEAIQEMGEKPAIRHYIDRNAFDIGFYSSLHSEFFQKSFYINKEKKLPDEVMTWPKELQKHVLYGLCLGDGCNTFQKEYGKTNRGVRNAVVYTTTSKPLAQQIQIILQRLRINYHCKRNIRKEPRQPQYSFEILADIFNFDFSSSSKKSCNIYYDNYYLIQVKNIEIINYTEDLYNFEVEEDNSYVTRIGAVHNCEGFGMPLVEAASCGVPIFFTDCTGMRDFTKNLSGTPIKVQRWFREAETHRNFGLPDEQDFVEKLFKFLTRPVELRRKKGYEARMGVEAHYTWQHSVDKYLEYFEKAPYADWSKPIPLHNPVPTNPHPDNNELFVKDAIRNILGDESYVNSFMCARMINDLNYSARMERYGGFQVTDLSFLGMKPQYKPYNREEAVNELLEMAQQKLYWEQVRMGMVKRPTPEFIQIANS